MVRGCLSWIETPEGRLTSRDLAGMQLRAKTVVITGCQTARRMIQPGDEWLGLMRALYMSCASSIVAAFWDIRDEAARRFSTEFYKHFDGDNTPSAVQKASAAVRTWQTHPYFWSGFGAFVRKNC
jgi:CHAT domain-containing protein